jgi:aminobenzoyl-glutamate utilization protein B
MLTIPAGFAGYLAWAANALGGLAPCIDQTVHVAGKTSGTTALERLTQPEVLKAARAEWKERTGGARRVLPLLPKDFAPPIDYRRPEYEQRQPAMTGGSRRLPISAADP